jgi:hypothetical protein
MIETSIKREKQGFTMDNRKKSLTGSGMAHLPDLLEKRNVSPRKVISFNMLDEAETNNTHTNS